MMRAMAYDKEQMAIWVRNYRAQNRPNNNKRICKHSECDTVLSMYNHDEYCAIHLKEILMNSTSLAQWLP
jgi:hypothetical protein